MNFNGADFVLECLAALDKQTQKPGEVIVVDNASTDRSVDAIRGSHPGVTLVLNSSNRGFSGGCNDGTARAKGRFVVLLNPDTRPAPDWLEALLKRAALAGPGDLVCSLILDDDKERAHYAKSATINIVGRLAWVETGLPEFQFAAAGAAMIFEKALYPVPFPDEYFLYHEDEYMSWAARLRGRDIVLARESEVPHRGSAAVNRARPVATFHGEKNRLANFLTFWEPRTRWRLAPLWALDLVLHLPQAPAERSRAAVHAWRHRQLYRARAAEVGASRRVSDAEILSLMTARVSPRGGRLHRAYNRAALKYCECFGLATMEARPAAASGAKPAGGPPRSHVE